MTHTRTQKIKKAPFSLISFVFKSALMGLIISACLLAFVPQLRQGDGLINILTNAYSDQERVSYYDAISEAAPAVVNIYTQGIEYRRSAYGRRSVESQSLGSGVIMTADGYILTCYHVVANADLIMIGLQDERFVEASMIGYDKATDLAVLKIDAPNLNVIPQRVNEPTKVGDVVLAIGNPYNLGQTITQGIISSNERKGLANYVDYLQLDAALSKGNSGGALIDTNGVLVGINNAEFKTKDEQGRIMSVEGVYFAVPYASAKSVMDEIIASGTVTRGSAGFGGAEFRDGTGIYVTEIALGGPADQAGLRQGDVLLSVNGERSNKLSRALQQVSSTPPGGEVRLDVQRGDQVLQLVITVVELKVE